MAATTMITDPITQITNGDYHYNGSDYLDY